MTGESPNPQTPEGIAAPGLIARYTLSFGDQGTGIQLESFHDRDASQEEIDFLCDKMVRAGDRVKAKHQLPVFRRQLESVEAKHADNLVRQAGVKAQLAAVTEERERQTLLLSAQRDQALKEAQDAWYASGKRGEFKPQGATSGMLGRLNAQITQLADHQTRDKNEAKVQLSVLENEIKEGDRALDQMRTLIAEAERVARGEDVSGVEER